MKILLDIPEDILTIIEASDGKVGREQLSKQGNISEMEARLWLSAWKKKVGDTSPKSLGLQYILQERCNKQASIIKKLHKLVATDHILLDQIKSTIPAFKLVKSVPNVKPKQEKIEERDVIAVWSDFHADEVVKSSQMEGMNEYNREALIKG